jgi:hypothetical protein
LLPGTYQLQELDNYFDPVAFFRLVKFYSPKSMCCCRGNNGTHIVIKDMDVLARDIFPAYFKHTNFLSFARQLNFYGFRKVKSKDYCIYHHDYFQNNRTELLSFIRRQASDSHHDHPPAIGTNAVAAASTNTSEVIELKEKVNRLTTTVTALHQEVADLKSLVTSLVDVIQSHSAQLQQQHVSHVTTGDTVDDIPTSYSESYNDAMDESLKPKATTPNQSFVDIPYQESYSEEPPTVHVNESPSAKRQKTSSEPSYSYATVAQKEGCIPLSMDMATTAQWEYQNQQDRWLTSTSVSENESHVSIDETHNSANPVAAAVSLQDAAYECTVDNIFGFEDLTWFALFEEDVSHKTDDHTFAPQA